ncbi:hypothetical protein [Lentzea sp. NPDC004782]|uniref:hypothetical protein n=1 Tax=Lentzea sp. NPDC004782 TaxID=3154458 RepID=UPI0033BAD2D9
MRSVVSQADPSHLVVFDVGGVTRRPDHHRVTRAALAAAADLDVAALNGQFGRSFAGRSADHIMRQRLLGNNEYLRVLRSSTAPDAR